jgi:AcrR family transcriptional regulator
MPYMRKDALRNRERVLQAAAETFAKAGNEAQMDDIAKRCGLGVGTLYRHFRTKDKLLEALLLDGLERFLAAARTSREQAPTPWDAFAVFARTAAHMLVANRALKELTQGLAARSPELEEKRHEVQELVATLVRDAQRSGELRADFSVDDLPILFSGLGATTPTDATTVAGQTDRFVDIILDGLRAPGHTPLRGDPLSLEGSER